MNARRGFAFGSYVVDPLRRLVWEGGELRPFKGKAFEILVYLLERRDRVVDKDELLKAVWPDTFVQENNLVRHISTLRRALGQRADQHDYILTVQGRGYQFVGEVTELDAFPSGLAALGAPDRDAGAEATEAPVRPETTGFQWGRLRLAAIGVVLAVVAGATVTMAARG